MAPTLVARSSSGRPRLCGQSLSRVLDQRRSGRTWVQGTRPSERSSRATASSGAAVRLPPMTLRRWPIVVLQAAAYFLRAASDGRLRR